MSDMGKWAKRQLIEVLSIVGERDEPSDDATRLMKLSAIRRLVESQAQQYCALCDEIDDEWPKP